jgi:drug/metabolite transporter (DMT)-like permease
MRDDRDASGGSTMTDLTRRPARDAAAAAAPRAISLGALVLLGVLTLCWGLNWPILKIALRDVPVLPFRALCLMIAGPLVMLVAAVRGDRLMPRRTEIWPLLAGGLLNVSVWHLLSATGVALLPAGRASIIAYTMPAWAAVLGALVLGERLTFRGIAGLCLGMAGVAVLVLPDWRHVLAAPAGVAAMLLAAIDWAAGTIMVKRFQSTLSVAAVSGWQTTIGGVPILAAAMIIGPFPGLDRATPETWLAIGYVIFLGMAFGQWAWYKLIELMPAGIAAISTLAIPAVGVIGSALMLGEAIGAAEIVALGLVLCALALVLRPGAHR